MKWNCPENEILVGRHKVHFFNFFSFSNNLVGINSGGCIRCCCRCCCCQTGKSDNTGRTSQRFVRNGDEGELIEEAKGIARIAAKETGNWIAADQSPSPTATGNVLLLFFNPFAQFLKGNWNFSFQILNLAPNSSHRCQISKMSIPFFSTDSTDSNCSSNGTGCCYGTSGRFRQWRIVARNGQSGADSADGRHLHGGADGTGADSARRQRCRTDGWHSPSGRRPSSVSARKKFEKGAEGAAARPEEIPRQIGQILIVFFVEETCGQEQQQQIGAIRIGWRGDGGRKRSSGASCGASAFEFERSRQNDAPHSENQSTKRHPSTASGPSGFRIHFQSRSQTRNIKIKYG